LRKRPLQFDQRTVYFRKEVPNSSSEGTCQGSAKEPYISAKEHYSSATEHYISAKVYISAKEYQGRVLTAPVQCRKRALHLCKDFHSTKEPDISAKESYTSTKEPQNIRKRALYSAKEPCMSQAGLHFHKNPPSTCKRLVTFRKRALHFS